MNLLDKPLLSLTAENLMSPAVLTLPPDMSLAAAAERLAEAQLKGAPVVDDDGHCVGVITTTDFLYAVMRRKDSGGSRESYFAAWQIGEARELPCQTVRNLMSSPPRTVTPETPIGLLARLMLDCHISRLIVVERDGKLAGIVSATDVLRAIAAIEQRAETQR